MDAGEGLPTAGIPARPIAAPRPSLAPPGATADTTHMWEARYRALLVASGQITWTAHGDGSEREADDWAVFTGQSPAASRSWGWLDALHPDDRERAAAAWKLALATGSVYEIDYRLRRHDGVYRWLFVRGVPVLAEDGSVEEWVGSATDITERKLAEERLRLLQEVTARFAGAQTLTEVRGILLGEVLRAVGARGVGLRLMSEDRDQLVLDGHVLGGVMSEEVLRRVARIALADEHPAAEVAREGRALFIHDAEECAERYPTLAWAVRQNRTEGVAHLPLIRGEEVFGALSFDFAEPRAWTDDERAFAMALADRLALSYERARLFEAERETRRHLETVLDALPAGVIIADAQGRILRVNQAFRDAWGGHALAQGMDEYRIYKGWHPDGRPLADEDWALARALLHGETVRGQEVDIQAFDGTRKTLLNNAAPLRDDAGRVSGGVVAFVDLTERRRLEREAAEPARQLEVTFESMADPIILYDVEGRMVRYSAAAAELFAFDRMDDATLASVAGRRAVTTVLDASGQPIAPEDLPVSRVLRGEVLTGGRMVDMTLITVDGRAVELSASGAPLRDAGGQIQGGVVLYRDVTEHRRLERERDEQARLLETTLRAMPDAAALCGSDGRALLVNAAFRELFSLEEHPDFFERSVEERRSQLGLLDLHGNALPPDLSPFERVLRRGETLTGAGATDMLARTPDGRLLELEVVGSPIRQGDGAIIGAVLLYRDVTGRRHLERRTREALEAFIEITRTLVEAPDEPDGAPPTDTAGLQTERLRDDQFSHMRTENPLARRLTELTRGVLGCSRVAVTSAEERDGHLYDWPLAIAGMSVEHERQWWAEQLAVRPREVGAGLAPEDRERLIAGDVLTLDLTRPPYQVSTSYGITSLLWVAMRIQGRVVGFLALDFVEPGGKPHSFTREEIQIAEAVARLGAVLLERDRLIRERAEAQARELVAVEAARRMDEFLSIASHELRTPLTTIKANVQMADRRAKRLRTQQGELVSASSPTDSAEDVRRDALSQLSQLLSSAFAATERQERLVQDLLDVSRIASGKLEYRMENFDLVALTREVVGEQRLVTPGRAISVSAPRTAVIVFADSDRVRQVLANYLTNALKYSPSEQPVAVSLRRVGRRDAQLARVEVRDQGPGLSDEQRLHLFERFHRVSGIEVQSGSGVGLGLGLYITKTIVEQHGGAVGVESAPGKGSAFWFELPLA